MIFNVVYMYHDSLQVMEEHRVCQAKIVDALEAEKRKISKELEEMQKKRAFREHRTLQHGESFQATTECLLELGTTVTVHTI